MTIDRRRFIQNAGIFAGTLATGGAGAQDVAPTAEDSTVARPASVRSASAPPRDAVFNVMDYGAVGDGKTNDVEAIQKTMVAADKAGGGVVFFPPGRYAMGAANGMIIEGSNLVIRGSGMWNTTIIATAQTRGGVLESSGAYPSQNVAIEDLTIDGGESASTTLLTLDGGALRNATVRRCRFRRIGTSGIAIAGFGTVIEDCLFEGLRSATGIAGTGISIGSRSTMGAAIRRCTFRWLTNGIVSASSQTIPIHNVTIEDCTFDMFWQYAGAAHTNQGAAVSYNATTLRDSTAPFGAIVKWSTIRVLKALHAGAITTAASQTVNDTNADFSAYGITEGDLVYTGHAMGIVTQVNVKGTLGIEQWMDRSTGLEVPPPPNATTYTVYKLWLGQVISNTSSALTTDRWKDIFGAPVPPPPAGTLYEVCSNRNNYHVLCNPFSLGFSISRCTFRRGWSDHIGWQGGSRITISDCVSEFGQDMGMTLNGDHVICTNNRFRNNGTSGIWLSASASVATGNVFEGWQCQNPAADGLGAITVSAVHVVVANNVINGNGRPNSFFGICIRKPCSDATITGNVITDSVKSAIHFPDNGCSNIRLYGNTGAVTYAVPGSYTVPLNVEGGVATNPR